jgi:hypothetical protein
MSTPTSSPATVGVYTEGAEGRALAGLAKLKMENGKLKKQPPHTHFFNFQFSILLGSDVDPYEQPRHGRCVHRRGRRLCARGAREIEMENGKLKTQPPHTHFFNFQFSIFNFASRPEGAKR